MQYGRRQSWLWMPSQHCTGGTEEIEKPEHVELARPHPPFPGRSLKIEPQKTLDRDIQ
jgi:hypothetical protein